MFADAGDLETGVDWIDKPFKWFAKHNPGRWEGGRYAEGSSPAEVLGMLRRLSAAQGADAARCIRLWTHGEVNDRKFGNAADAAAWIEQQAHAICFWTSPQSEYVHAQHPAETQVRVRGLTQAAKHNGKRGKILAFNDAKQRYDVRLLEAGERIFIKPGQSAFSIV